MASKHLQIHITSKYKSYAGDTVVLEIFMMNKTITLLNHACVNAIFSHNSIYNTATYGMLDA